MIRTAKYGIILALLTGATGLSLKAHPTYLGRTVGVKSFLLLTDEFFTKKEPQSFQSILIRKNREKQKNKTLSGTGKII